MGARTIFKSGLTVLLALAVAAPAFAAGKEALYLRTSVSLGALTGASDAVFTGTLQTVVERDGAGIAVCTVDSTLKGIQRSEFALHLNDPAWKPAGPFLAFAVLCSDGNWRLAGGESFGAVPLEETSRDLFLQTVQAHLNREDAKARAAKLLEGFRSSVHRLRADAVVDFHLEPALLDHLDADGRSALLAPLRDASARAHLHRDMAYAVLNVGRIGGDDAFDALIAYLNEPEARPFSDPLARAFLGLGAAYAQPFLVRFLEQTDAGALPAYITVAANLKLVAAGTRMTALASHADETVRLYAILGLGDLGDETSTAFLSELLRDEERPLQERRYAVLALGHALVPAGVQTLVEMETKAEDPALRKFIHAFRRYPARTRHLLLRGLYDED